MLASPNAGEYLQAFYLIAWEVLDLRTGSFKGFLPIPSVSENKYESEV